MDKKYRIPWEEINEFLLEIENIRDRKMFYEIFLNSIHNFVPYDQARLYEKDLNGKIIDSIIIKVDDWWNDAYVRYYSQISKDINNKIIKNKNDFVYEQYRIITWKDYEAEEFFSNYIKPQGIEFTLGFNITNSEITAECGLDRVSGRKFTKDETEILKIIHSHIQVLFENFSYYKEISHRNIPLTSLTKRENEIINLLILGATPNNIGKKLFISITTVYRHIANIYSKLGVSNRQELLLKFLEKYNPK